MVGTTRDALTTPIASGPNGCDPAQPSPIRLLPLPGEGWGGGQRRLNKHGGPTPAPRAPIPAFPQRGKEIIGTARDVLAEPCCPWSRYGSARFSQRPMKPPPPLGEGWGGGQRRLNKHGGPTSAPRAPIPAFPQQGTEIIGTARDVLAEPCCPWSRYGSARFSQRPMKLPPPLGEGWGGGQRRPAKHGSSTPTPRAHIRAFPQRGRDIFGTARRASAKPYCV